MHDLKDFLNPFTWLEIFTYEVLTTYGVEVFNSSRLKGFDDLKT
jgi:hypothetical protein